MLELYRYSLKFSAHGIAIIAFGLILSLSSQSKADEAMTSEELVDLVSGNTAYGTNTRGKNFIQVFHTDGRLESGGTKGWGSWEPKETGTWEVKEGQLCNSYTKPKVRSGGCDKFFKADDGSYYYKTGSGKTGYFNKIVPGRSPDE